MSTLNFMSGYDTRLYPVSGGTVPYLRCSTVLSLDHSAKASSLPPAPYTTRQILLVTEWFLAGTRVSAFRRIPIVATEGFVKSEGNLGTIVNDEPL